MVQAWALTAIQLSRNASRVRAGATLSSKALAVALRSTSNRMRTKRLSAGAAKSGLLLWSAAIAGTQSFNRIVVGEFMSQLVQVNQNTVAEYTPDQLKLITDTVAKGASKDELQLFLYRCKSMGFDPLKPGQIHFVKYGNGSGTIVVGIDGFRARAMRSGKLNGIARGVIRDAKGACIGAWAEVRRKDWDAPARIEVALAEYTTGRGPWQKMPETMIQKVAEAAALRMAFPDDLGGVYAQEEMDQAEARGSMQIVPEQPSDEDGIAPNEYRIPFGQWRKLSIEEVYRKHGAEKIASYIQFLEDSAQKKGVEMNDQAKEFIERAEMFLGVMENQTAEAEA